MTPQVETFTGKLVNPFDLKLDDICLEDIARHLSMLCRFNGACREFYSVATHSILVMEYLRTEDKETRIRALLHDAHEAYLGDIVRPLKQQIYTLQIDMERAQKVIERRFGIAGSQAKVDIADNTLLMAEAHVLMPSKGHNWDVGETGDVERAIELMGGYGVDYLGVRSDQVFLDICQELGLK